MNFLLTEFVMYSNAKIDILEIAGTGHEDQKADLDKKNAITCISKQKNVCRKNGQP